MRLPGALPGLFSSVDRPAGWCSLIGVPAAGRGKRRRRRRAPGSPVCGSILVPAFRANPRVGSELRSTEGSSSAISPEEADAGGIFGRRRRRPRCVRTLPSREALTPGPPSPAADEASCGAESGPSAGGPSTAWISSRGAASAVPVSGLVPRCRRRRRREGSPSPWGLAESSSGCGATPASRGGRRRRRRRGRRGGSLPTTVSAFGSAVSFASSSACCWSVEVGGPLSPLTAGRTGADTGVTRSLGGSSGECDIGTFPPVVMGPAPDRGKRLGSLEAGAPISRY